MTEAIPLGTASAIPAHGRHLAACALRHEGRVLLFDCGEGTQYRLLDAGIVISPGSMFGPANEGFFRVALVPSTAGCQEAIERWSRL